MADNALVNTNTAASGATNENVAADDIGGAKYQRVKINYGDDGVAVDVSATNPLPVTAINFPAPVGGSQPVVVRDVSGTAIGSLGSGTGALGLLVAAGATEFFFSTANSSVTQLAAGATFTGTVESIINAQAFSIILTSDQPGTLTLTEYIDVAGVRALPAKIYAITAGIGFSRCFTANGNYFRATFQNTGGSATTTLNINVAFGTLPAVTALGSVPVALNEVNGTALAFGQSTSAASIPVVPSSDYIAPVATFASVVAVTPTVTATTYAANKVAGGVLTLTGALRSAKNTGILNSVQLNFNTTAPTQGFVVSFFSANPTASTFTDNTVAAIAAADVGKLLGQVTMNPSSSTLGTHTAYTASSIGLDVSGTSGTVYAVVQCVGASVFAATTTFTNAIFGFLQD